MFAAVPSIKMFVVFGLHGDPARNTLDLFMVNVDGTDMVKQLERAQDNEASGTDAMKEV